MDNFVMLLESAVLLLKIEGSCIVNGVIKGDDARRMYDALGKNSPGLLLFLLSLMIDVPFTLYKLAQFVFLHDGQGQTSWNGSYGLKQWTWIGIAVTYTSIMVIILAGTVRVLNSLNHGAQGAWSFGQWITMATVIITIAAAMLQYVLSPGLTNVPRYMQWGRTSNAFKREWVNCSCARFYNDPTGIIGRRWTTRRATQQCQQRYGISGDWH